MRYAIKFTGVFVAIGMAMAQSSALLNRDHRDTHELDYKQTVGNTKELNERDRMALRDAIVAALGGSSGRSEASQAELRNTANAMRVELENLNNDGVPEVIVQAMGSEWCGAVGNCSMFIFTKNGSNYQPILRGIAQTISIARIPVSGYRDVVLGSHGSATMSTDIKYSYVNGHYRKSSCNEVNWPADDDPTVILKKPRITPCKYKWR